MKRKGSNEEDKLYRVVLLAVERYLDGVQQLVLSYRSNRCEGGGKIGDVHVVVQQSIFLSFFPSLSVLKNNYNKSVSNEDDGLTATPGRGVSSGKVLLQYIVFFRQLFDLEPQTRGKRGGTLRLECLVAQSNAHITQCLQLFCQLLYGSAQGSALGVASR